MIVLGEGNERNMQTKCASYTVIGNTNDPLSRPDEWHPIYHCRLQVEPANNLATAEALELLSPYKNYLLYPASGGFLSAQTPVWQPSPGHTQVPIWPGAAPDAQPVAGRSIRGDVGEGLAGCRKAVVLAVAT
jgi:hypothetical protein